MRCAVVGLGRVARNQYLPYLTALDDVEVAVLARRPAAAREAAAEFGATALDDLAAVPAWRPDTVFVLVTDTQHHVVVEELLARGLPRLYVEKPFVARHGQEHVDFDDLLTARRLASAAEAAGTEIAIGFNYRSFATVQGAISTARERNWGSAVGFTVRTHYACWSHCIDLIHYLVGPITRVAALEGSLVNDAGRFPAPDRVIAATTANGAAGTLHVGSWSGWTDTLFELEVQFERGRAVIRDLDAELELVDLDGTYRERRSLPTATSRTERYARSFRVATGDYLRRIGEGLAPAAGVADGLRELLVEAAIDRSLGSGRVVDLEAL